MSSYCGICNIYIHAWHQFSPGANWWSHSERQITTGLYHSLGSWYRAERREDAHSPVELEFDENQKSLPQYTDGRSLRTMVRTRATIVDMRGQLNIRQWEETASAATENVWFEDCESLFSQLIFPSTKQVDNKRLAIDLPALKELIWDNRDDCDEEVDLSSLDRHVGDAGRLLDKDDDFWPTERNVEYGYL